MRDYELTVIISPQVEEEKLTSTVDKVSRWVTDKKGGSVQVESQGKRRLSFPIKRFQEGNYVLFKFQGDSALTKEVESNLRMSEDILRYLLVKAVK